MMVTNKRLVVAVGVLSACLGGCWDGEGRITSASLREFWRRSVGAAFAIPSALTSPAPVPVVVDEPVRGTLHASRRGSTVTVDVVLSHVPDEVGMLATGLRLADGAAVYPRTVSTREGPDGAEASGPGVEFDFTGQAARFVPGEAARSFRMTYELAGKSASADGSTFTLVLGEPDSALACRSGITLGVSIQDGGPAVCECVKLADADEMFPPPPAGAEPSPPTVSFLFRETPSARGGPLVWIVPKVAPGLAGLGGHRPSIAARPG